MAKDLNKALQEVEMTYSQIRQLADDMLAPAFQPINALVDEIQGNIERMPVELVRDYLLKVQLSAYSISELKDRSSVKAVCAEMIKKEAYATSYTGQEGTAALRDANATIAVSENTVAQCLYELVASLVKTKLDSLHRLADVLKSVLMSKMQEAKFFNVGTSNDIPATTDGRITLHS